MGSNFEWQRLQVKERIDSALGEARSHRMAYQNVPKRGFSMFGLLKGIFTTSKELLSIEHKTDIPATQDQLIEEEKPALDLDIAHQI